MPTDAQTLTNIIATEGYDKLSKRALLESILAAVASGGGGGACSDQSGIGSPVGVKTPGFVGQLYTDTTGPNYWRSTGLTAADWTAIGGSGVVSPFSTTPSGSEVLFGYRNWGGLPGVTKVTAIGPAPQDSISIAFTSDLQTFDGSVLTSIDLTNNNNGGLTLMNNTSLNSIILTALQQVSGELNVQYCSALSVLTAPALTLLGGPLITTSSALTSIVLDLVTSINGSVSAFDGINGVGCAVLSSVSLASVITVTGNVNFSACPLFTSVNLSAWVPTDGTTINFQGDGLNAASVELILRRCVLASVTTCTVALNLGTNAGLASLSAQGQADYAALVTAGNTMLSNP